MDYKEKYEQALERCRKLYNEAKANEYTSDIEDYETIFPELAESEDERIRKMMIRYFESCGNLEWYDGLTPQKAVAWLEKQGEHASFRNKIQVGDKVTRNEAGVLVNLSQLKRVAKPEENNGNLGGISANWSEEDDGMIRHCVAAIYAADYYDLDDKENMEKFLESIKQRIQKGE